MKKIDVKSKIFNEMKLPELFAQVLSKKLDISYEQALKFAENKFSEKIEEVNKTITHIGNVDNYNVESPMDLDDFTKGKKILKG